MEHSILTSTKKVLQIPEDYDVFDQDILTYINSAFATLSQLGYGPEGGFDIEDDTALWSDYEPIKERVNLVRTYVFLKCRLMFDPPGTSFHLEAVNKQIAEHEWRLSAFREVAEQEAANAAEEEVE